MKIILRRTLSNWYSFDVRFSIERLLGYIKSVEKNIMHGIEHYKQGVKTVRTEEMPNGHVLVTDIYNGLNSDSYDLDHVFNEYFPTLQRRSAFVTLYSFLEQTLNELCDLCINEKSLTLKLNDLNKSQGYIFRARTFLTKVVGLDIDINDKTWKEIESFRELRNVIAHNDGIFAGNPSIVSYIKQSEFLGGSKDIIIMEGFLEHVVVIFDRQFQQINRLINASSASLAD